ncbi:hypothetical protein [Uliginosibacterium sp. TH139]|nr:hypothetical protein [Uliginosibacterium sp. TH139]
MSELCSSCEEEPVSEEGEEVQLCQKCYDDWIENYDEFGSGGVF